MNLNLRNQISILILGALLFIPFLGQVHLFDWDEINFAEAAREMLVSKNYLRVQIDFQPFWEKPPLFIWLQALSMSLFGINEFAARLPNALVGIVTLSALFNIGRKVVNEKMAWIWVLLYVGTWLPFFYFKTAIIDPLFNLFIFLAFFQFYQIRLARNKSLSAVLAGLFLGLAVLTKGPVALLIAFLGLVVYFIWNKGLSGWNLRSLLLIGLLTFFISFSWFGVDIFHNGWWFTQTFIEYQIRLFSTGDAGHGQPFFYHPVVLLIGCFPASVFLFRLRNKIPVNLKVKDYKRWMWILFWVVLILFSIVKTKIVHYSSLCYFPITFLAAFQIANIDATSMQSKKRWRILFLILGSLWAIILTAVPILGNNKERLIPYIKDDFAVANLQADVHWPYYLCAIGIIYLVLVILTFIRSREDFQKSILRFLIFNMLTIFLTMIFFTPRIEAYSQAAAIEFYESLKDEDVYIVPMGFRSYAHLFYAKKRNNNSTDYETKGTKWLLEGEVEKPVYFICKINYSQELDQLPQLEKLGSKNGFVFYKRK